MREVNLVGVLVSAALIEGSLKEGQENRGFRVFRKLGRS